MAEFKLWDTIMSGSIELYHQAMNQGHSAAWDQDWEKAADYYRQALHEMPDNTQALASLGLALYELCHYSEAIKVYARAATLSVDDPVPIEKVSQLYEQLGNPENAIKSARRAAELYLKKRDSEKAIDNLLRAAQLNPEDLAVRSRLAVIYEGLGRKQQAVTEYIYIASIIQAKGDIEKARQALNHAIAIMPGSTEAHQALELLNDSKPLPKPVASKEPVDGNSSTEQEQDEEPEVIKKGVNNQDPITEAQNNALTILAGLLFDPVDEHVIAESGVVPGTLVNDGVQSEYIIDQTDSQVTLLHLSQAVNLQTQGIIDKAAEELELAINAGINHPAALFNLGFLRSKSQQTESALSILQQVVDNPDFGLAAHLIRGNIFRNNECVDEAAVEYLEALRLADSQVVSADEVDELWILYDDLIETVSNQEESQTKERLCKSILEILLQKEWLKQLKKDRQDLLCWSPEGGLIPLGKIIVEASSLKIIEVMREINQLAGAGKPRSAMEEAFFAINFGPTFLPLHEQIGDLLLGQERLTEALDKYKLIARTYSVHGDRKHAVELLRKVLRLAPTDLEVRKLLIHQLFEAGYLQEAVYESLKLGEFYVNQAELRKARLSFSEAQELAQKANADSGLIVQILHQMADIDLQSLNWQQALQVYAQIRRLQPGDEQARIKLIDLNFRLGKETQAIEELDSYIEYLLLIEESEKAITFVENLLKDKPERIVVRRRLGYLYGKNGRIKEAIAQFNFVGQTYLKMGNREAAVEIIEEILEFDPPNRVDFERLLARLQTR